MVDTQAQETMIKNSSSHCLQIHDGAGDLIGQQWSHNSIPRKSEKNMRHSFIFRPSISNSYISYHKNRLQISSTGLTPPKARHPRQFPTLLHLSGRHFLNKYPKREVRAVKTNHQDCGCATPLSTSKLELYFKKHHWSITANTIRFNAYKHNFSSIKSCSCFRDSTQKFCVPK